MSDESWISSPTSAARRAFDRSDARTVRRELKAYDATLARKKQIVGLNKCDALEADAIEKKRKPVADIESAHRSSCLPMLGMLSYKAGRSIQWDAEKEEMRHADRLVKRILMLDGHPNLQALNKLKIGTNVEERLQADWEAETAGRGAIVETITLCETKQDYVTRDLLTQLLDDTEEHIDFLETQLAVLAQVGLQNYLQSQYELD